MDDDGPPSPGSPTPNCSQISGQITGTGAVTFSRKGTTGCNAVNITWYVAEFAAGSGVSVQRGSIVTDSGANSYSATLSPSVTTSQSVPIISVRITGTNINSDDFWTPTLSSSQITVSSADNSLGVLGTVEWQVVSFGSSATVTTGTYTMANATGTATATVSIPALDKAWLFHYFTSPFNGAGMNIGAKLVRGYITGTGANNLSFFRNPGASNQTTIAGRYYVVVFSDGTTVQQGNSTFSTSGTSNSLSLPVDASWAVAGTTGTYGYHGAANLNNADSDNDNFGVASFKMTCASGCTGTGGTNSSWTLSRAVTSSAAAEVGWYVVQFSPNPTAVKLQDFSVTRTARGNLVRWRTGLEVDNLGFRVVRGSADLHRGASSEVVAGAALLASGLSAATSARSYQWLDREPAEGSVYYLESIGLDGTAETRGPAEVRSPLLGAADITLSPPLEGRGLPPPPRTETMAMAIDEPGTLSRAWRPVGDPDRQIALVGRGGVKITVREEGVQRVTAPSLRAAGLAASADPRRLALSTEGRDVAIRVVGEQDGRLDEGDAIEFYGVPVDEASTDGRVYFLRVDESPGLRMRLYEPGDGAPIERLRHRSGRRDRTVYFAALRDGERPNFFGPALTGGALSLDVAAPAPLAGRPAALRVTVQGVGHTPHEVDISWNGASVGTLTLAGQTHGALTAMVPSLAPDGVNHLGLRTLGGDADVVLLDEVTLDYERRPEITAAAARLSVKAGGSLTLRGLPDTTLRVWDVTDPAAPRILPTSAVAQTPGRDTWQAHVNTPGEDATDERTLLAFTAQAVRAPSRVEPDRTPDVDALGEAAFVIVAPASLAAALEPLAAARRGVGLATLVVTAESLDDRFGYGRPSWTAIRIFLRKAATAWRVAPRYVLLVGDSSVDPRGYLGLPSPDVLSTSLVDTRYLETASDEPLVDLNGDGVGDLAVGRLPVRTRAEAEAVVAKILAFAPLDDGQAAGALFLADQVGANDGDFEGDVVALAAALPPRFVATSLLRSMWGAGTGKAFLAALALNPLLVGYVGHGSPGSFAGGTLSNDDVATLGSMRPAVFINLTCLTGFFHDPYGDSLGETLVRAPVHGAVSVVASTGLALPAEQLRLGHALIDRFASGERTLGDALREAKDEVCDDDVVRTYTLLGDPTLRMASRPSSPSAVDPSHGGGRQPADPASGSGAGRSADGSASLGALGCAVCALDDARDRPNGAAFVGALLWAMRRRHRRTRGWG